MQMRWPQSGLWTAAAFFLIGVSAAPTGGAMASQAYQACLRDVVEMRRAAFVRFQNALHDLLVRDSPEFAAVADVNRDMQVTFNALRSRRLFFMIETKPERFRELEDLSAFMNLQMDKADESTLEGRDTDYRNLLAEQARHKERTRARSDWDAVRTRFRAIAAEDPDYTASVAQHQAAYGAAEARFLECRKLTPAKR